MIEQGTAIAAELLETAAVDIAFDDGMFRVAGTDRSVSLQQVIAASFDDQRRPAATAPGLLASEVFTPPDSTFPNGCHVCEVEVDEATGETVILRYTIQDDMCLAHESPAPGGPDLWRRGSRPGSGAVRGSSV